MNVLDAEIRKEILSDGIDNIFVTADAGCGKTTILIDKIFEVMALIDNHKTIAAITFTRKATADIKKRLNKSNINKEVVIATNDSFVENQIIRPFLKDALGEDYNNQFTLTYASPFNSFEEGLEKLKKDNELAVYSDNQKNFKFELALFVLKSSIAAQQYLRAKFRMLFLDEYQDSDSDSDMHNLFMYIKDKLEIALFVVGDPKQAIYLWRGAKENIFNEFDNSFKKYSLFHNFRSHENITNLANLLHSPDYKNNQAVNPSQIKLVKATNRFDYEVLKVLNMNMIDKNKEITIIINLNNSAAQCAKFLRENGYNFTFIPRTPIDEGVVHNYELKSIAKLILNDYYSLYNFTDEMYLDIHVKQIEKLNTFVDSLSLASCFEEYQESLQKFGDLMNIHFTKNEVESFKETIENEKYHQSFLEDDAKHKIMTVFTTKGLEFDQVIFRANDYTLVGANSINNHYVALTRAKEQVIIIDDTNSYKNAILEKLESTNISSINEVLVETDVSD